MDRWTTSARRPASSSPADSPIAFHGKACVQHFAQLCALLEDTERQSFYGISLLQVSESSGQFRIWAGNIGALQAIQSTSSLDYRLREVPKVSSQVVSLLEDLEEALADVIAITSGERENRVSSPAPFNTDLVGDSGTSLSETVNNRSEPAFESTSEIQELFQSVPETIASLFKLSILIRNSSSRDRYSKALAATSKALFNEQFDIDHVGNKYPRLYREDKNWLRERLGKAITQKRHYLRYCREHREKLSKIPEARNPSEAIAEPKMSDAFLAIQSQESKVFFGAQTVISRPTSTLAPTTASTVIPAKLEHLEEVEEQNEDDNRSHTSYATSVNDDDGDNRLSVVRLEEVAGTAQSFECPYCWTIQRINNQHSWRKHVMRDLKPYVCTSEECDMKLFPDRNTWFTHELQNHLVEWNCCFCSHLPHQTRDKFEKHVRKAHPDKFVDDQLLALIKACQKPVDKLPATACPFCDKWEARLREFNQQMSADEILVVTPQQFRHHVGSHMEQLALFAIPRGYKENGDADSGGAVPGHGSDSSSDRSLVRPDYENEDNPRLHIAAFQGLHDEVKALIEENKKAQANLNSTRNILLEGGSTWGSALSAASAGGHVDIAYLCLPQDPNLRLRSTLPYRLDRLARSKSKGWGPLHWAASNGHLPVTEFLIKNGVSVENKAFDGSTAADLARGHGHDEIVRFLEQETQHDLEITIIRAEGLIKRDIFSLPNPVAFVILDGASVFLDGATMASTTVFKKSLAPNWNETFKLRATRDSFIAVSIYDHKKQKQNGQGFLGGIKFRVGELINLNTKSSEIITRDFDHVHLLTKKNLEVTGTLVLSLNTDLSDAHSTAATHPDYPPLPRMPSPEPLKPPLKPVFGLSLQQLFERDGTVVPRIVLQCIQAIDRFGMEVDGIYDTPGNPFHINQMRAMFYNDASKVDFSNPVNFFHDIHSVADLLKLFFRELPDPLLSEYYEEFIEAVKIHDDIAHRDSLHMLVNTLQDPNYATLRALMLHLHRITEASSINRMDSKRLAMVFAPTLMGGSILDRGWQDAVIRRILRYVHQIFNNNHSGRVAIG